MEEVPAHVHPGPLNLHVLTRHGNHETCITNLQKIPLICYEIMEYNFSRCVMRQFARDHLTSASCDTRLDLHKIQLRENEHTYWGTHHASRVEVWHQGDSILGMALSWQLRIYHSPGTSTLDGIRISHECTSEIQQITSMVQEVDDMAIGAISFSLSLTPPVLSHPSGLGTSYASLPPSLEFSSFRSPLPPSLGFSSFQDFSLCEFMISGTSSFGHNERTDDLTLAQQLEFGHRVGKKTSRDARDAYGPYFTGVIQKSWTLQLKPNDIKCRTDPNLWSVRMMMRMPSSYEEHPYNDNEMRYL
ncbi:hypothetical protein M9H77_09417 [Catharanthus roseus]|uniref:Uncharacterized protein n=1 Tax=Catharanthus roseus TaxID=4058 RepID=A0ACC0C0Q4_CATRO|nr:hypothetical protein M9H77_09417 [Catharanthus roseus]